MKNSVRHLVLGLAGIACVFALDSCAPRVAEKPKVEVQKVKESGPRCTRDVVNELPGKFESLSCMFFINNEYVVTTWRYEDETEPAFYKLNLKDLTLVPWQIGAKDKDIRFWEHYDKTTLFVTKTNDKYSIIMMGPEHKTIIPLPYKHNPENANTVPHPFLYQNRLYVLFGTRLLQWDIVNGRAQALPEDQLKLLRDSDYSASIENIDGEKLWISDVFNSNFVFDLKLRKTILVNKGNNTGYLEGLCIAHDRHRRGWTWKLGKEFENELVCHDKGQVISKHVTPGIRVVFFDKEDNPMIWTRSGEILKLVEDKWISVVEIPDFAKDSAGFWNALVLEDGRICLLSNGSMPEVAKDDSPALAIIDSIKKEYEVMSLSFKKP
ncbi:hypothetical protein KA183_21070 [bacterium]|nr:hypothetical protein [bacterium]